MTTSADHVAAWLDWCAATGVDPRAPTWGDVQAFSRDLPVASATTTRRLSAIRAHYARHRHTLTGEAPPARDRLWPASASHAVIATHLRAVASYGWPEAIRGRRDAVIVLLAAQGLTRRQISAAVPALVDMSVVPSLCGRELPRTVDTFGCSACALTRWLRVLDLWVAGSTGLHVIEEFVSQAPLEPGTHDCVWPVQMSSWAAARWLVCGVASNGHLMFEPVGLRSVTTAIGQPEPRPCAGSPAGEAPGPLLPVPGRSLSPAERREQLRGLDDLLDQLDRMLADESEG